MPRPTIWHQILYEVLGLFCLVLFVGAVLLLLHGLLAPPEPGAEERIGGLLVAVFILGMLLGIAIGVKMRRHPREEDDNPR